MSRKLPKPPAGSGSLVLARRVGESIVINGQITVTVLALHDRWGNVRLGIEAPRSVSVFRKELLEDEE